MSESRLFRLTRLSNFQHIILPPLSIHNPPIVQLSPKFSLEGKFYEIGKALGTKKFQLAERVGQDGGLENIKFTFFMKKGVNKKSFPLWIFLLIFREQTGPNYQIINFSNESDNNCVGWGVEIKVGGVVERHTLLKPDL